MLFVPPKGIVRLLKDVPIDRNYSYSLHFETKAKQTAYFASKAIITFAPSESNTTAVSYVRGNKGTIKLQVQPEQIYGCNYMMYQNQGFGDGLTTAKWFYAFIDKVDYVNNVTAEISFTLDPLQTYWFDFNFKNCFVEREHSRTDKMGEHIFPEDIQVTATDVQEETLMFPQSNSDLNVAIVVLQYPLVTCRAYTDSTTLSKWDNLTAWGYYSTGNFGGVPSTFAYYILPLNETNASYFLTVPQEYLVEPNLTATTQDQTLLTLEYFVSGVVNGNCEVLKRNDITTAPTPRKTTEADLINVYICPVELVKREYLYGTTTNPSITPAYSTLTTSANKVFEPATTWGSYSIVNKKMFTYPYTFLRVTNYGGDSKDFYYEYGAYNTATASMELNMIWINTLSYDFNCILGCNGYKHYNLDGDYNTIYLAETLSLPKPPQPAYSGNSFNQWWQANQTQWSTGLLCSVLSAIASVGASGFVGALSGAPGAIAAAQQGSAVTNIAQFGKTLTGGAAGVINSLAVLADAQRKPDKGYTGAANTLSQQNLGYINFGCAQYTLEPSIAKKVDDFFSYYGYKEMALKTPELANYATCRPKWNYLKTQQCIIEGKPDVVNQGFPAEAESFITDIFNTGITMWKCSVDSPADVGNYQQNNQPVVTE